MVFGCWTSVSRKSVLPVFEKDNGLLFYPVQYEGEELSKNIFYTAEAVNQQAIPAVDYMLAEGKKKFYLLGSDYVYPRTTNKILKQYLKVEGHPGFGHRRNLHAVRPHRLPDDRRGDQKVRRRRQGLRHQHAERRHQRSVLQGIRQRRPDLGKLPGRFVLDLGRRIPRPSRPSTSSASSAAGLTSCRIKSPENTKFVKDFMAWIKEPESHRRGLQGHRHRCQGPRHLQPDEPLPHGRVSLEAGRREGWHV